MFGAGAEVGDQLQPFAGSRNHSGVDAVRHAGHQHVDVLHQRHQFIV